MSTSDKCNESLLSQVETRLRIPTLTDFYSSASEKDKLQTSENDRITE